MYIKNFNSIKLHLPSKKGGLVGKKTPKGYVYNGVSNTMRGGSKLLLPMTLAVSVIASLMMLDMLMNKYLAIDKIYLFML
mgnify:CR=1 FL=1